MGLFVVLFVVLFDACLSLVVVGRFVAVIGASSASSALPSMAVFSLYYYAYRCILSRLDSAEAPVELRSSCHHYHHPPFFVFLELLACRGRPFFVFRLVLLLACR